MDYSHSDCYLLVFVFAADAVALVKIPSVRLISAIERIAYSLSVQTLSCCWLYLQVTLFVISVLQK